ncbi:MAG: FecR family protein [Gammaproteobacteria bacterium]
MSLGENAVDTVSLKQQAIDWLVRLRGDELSDGDMKAFADWLVQDYRHSEAFAFAEDLFGDMVLAVGKEPVEATTPAAEPPVSEKVVPLVAAAGQAKPNRWVNTKKDRRWTWIGVAAAAVWVFAVVLVVPDHSHPFDGLMSDYHTGKGELSNIRLADGSRILLNTNSAVSIDFDDSKRQIVLHHGQARFSVAEDTRRPFDVRMDEVYVRALGTVFEVYRTNADEGQVTVQEHSVSVGLAGDGARQNEATNSVVLKVGQRLNYRHGGNFSQIQSVDLDRATSWQQRRLVIDDRPLGDLIQELNRYRVGRVYIADAGLNDMHVTGVFSLENPDQILDSVCEVLGLKETKIAGLWVLLHR